jgi:hypothetical protein
VVQHSSFGDRRNIHAALCRSQLSECLDLLKAFSKVRG